MSSQAKISELLGILRDRQHFVVTSHARPDGDAIGSALAMTHLLEAMGKRVDVVFSDPIPAVYHVLEGVDRILHTLPSVTPDAIVLLECDCFDRTGFARAEWERMGKSFTINIDHHLSGRECGDFNWIVPDACAVGSLIYDVAVESGITISRGMATCLYTAVLTDTGAFTYSCTDASTFALAEHLVELGVDASAVARAIYYSNPVSKVHLLGSALRNLHVEGPLAWAWITLDDMSEAGAIVEDSEGIINYLIGIAGVEAAVFLRELPGQNGVRLSLRGKDVIDVSRVAEEFGGGGHRNASGCTISGDMEHARDLIVSHLRAQLPAESLLA